MNAIQSSLTFAAGQLFFDGRPVAGFRTLKVVPGVVRVTVYKALRDETQIKAMKASGVKVWSVK